MIKDFEHFVELYKKDKEWVLVSSKIFPNQDTQIMATERAKINFKFLCVDEQGTSYVPMKINNYLQLRSLIQSPHEFLAINRTVEAFEALANLYLVSNTAPIDLSNS